MALNFVKNKIFPIIVLLLAVTFNSFSAIKRAVLSEYRSISIPNTPPNQNKQADAETPQDTENTEQQESDDKAEDADSPFLPEYSSAQYFSHQVNHIYEFQIALYHEHQRVIFSPPPEA